jgi:cation/acetate symporter
MSVGTGMTLLLIFLSPTVQIDLLHGTDSWFPLKNPALVTIPLSFITGILVSLVKPEPAALEKHEKMVRRMHLGE